MSITHGQATVTTSATLIYVNHSGSVQQMHVHAAQGGQTVYLGGPGVLTTDGFALSTGDKDLPVLLHPNDALYGIVSSTTQDLSYIIT